MTDSRSILLVEDEKDIRFAVATILELEGYSVQTAENGSAALELLKKQGMPKLILLDMKMPVMNGWEFAVQLREKFERPAPILIMTAAADAEQRAKDINAAGWIEKPFLFEDLLAAVKKYFRT